MLLRNFLVSDSASDSESAFNDYEILNQQLILHLDAYHTGRRNLDDDFEYNNELGPPEIDGQNGPHVSGGISPLGK